MPVKAVASFSVSRALQLQLPKQLEVLEEVSEYASREYSLERALDKMQVSHRMLWTRCMTIDHYRCRYSVCMCLNIARFDPCCHTTCMPGRGRQSL